MLKLVGKFRWTIIGLFVGAMVINYLSRSVLGVAAPVILEEQRISSVEYGWITGAFQLGVMLQPLAGYFLDSVGLRIGFTLCVAVWSVVTMAHGLVNGWFGFAALRGLLGLAEGSAQPAGQKLVAEWFPSKERGVAGGIYNIGASFGAVFAPPLVAWAVMVHSWRLAFVVAGGIGLVWAIFWYLHYNSPMRHPRLSAEERDYILSNQELRLAAKAAKQDSKTHGALTLTVGGGVGVAAAHSYAPLGTLSMRSLGTRLHLLQRSTPGGAAGGGSDSRDGTREGAVGLISEVAYVAGMRTLTVRSAVTLSNGTGLPIELSPQHAQSAAAAALCTQTVHHKPVYVPGVWSPPRRAPSVKVPGTPPVLIPGAPSYWEPGRAPFYTPGFWTPGKPPRYVSAVRPTVVPAVKGTVIPGEFVPPAYTPGFVIPGWHETTACALPCCPAHAVIPPPVIPPPEPPELALATPSHGFVSYSEWTPASWPFISNAETRAPTVLGRGGGKKTVLQQRTEKLSLYPEWLRDPKSTRPFRYSLQIREQRQRRGCIAQKLAPEAKREAPGPSLRDRLRGLVAGRLARPRARAGQHAGSSVARQL